jgi:uncharacterized Zn finger protein (UPF0148 family)
MLRVRLDHTYLKDVHITPRPKLNGDHRHCPRCGAHLFQDGGDLGCLMCGWRESCYYYPDAEVISDTIYKQHAMHENSLANLLSSREKK